MKPWRLHLAWPSVAWDRSAWVLVASWVVLITLAPGAAEARNRTLEMLRSTLGGADGFSKAELDRFRHYQGPDDQRLFGTPIIVSGGTVGTRVGNQGHLLAMVRLYNESSVPICVRARGGWVTGALKSGEQVNNTGINMLLKPHGGNESVLSVSVRALVTSDIEHDLGFYFWAANMAAGEGRLCSSVAPPEVNQWLASPRSSHRSEFYFDPPLARQLGLGSAETRNQP